MIENNTVSISVIKTLVESMNALGLPALEFCRALDIDTNAFDDLRARVADEKFYVLMSMAHKNSDDPQLAFKLAGCAMPSLYGPLGYYLMSSKNIAELLSRTDKFQKHMTNSADFAKVIGKDNYHIQFGLPLAKPSATTTFIIEFMMSNAWKCIEWIYASPNLKPVAVCYTRSAPEDVKAYEDFFQCPVLFGQENNEILIDKNVFQLPNPSYNKVMDELHAQEIERLAMDSEVKTITSLVKEQIIELLPTGEASMQAISKNFNISERTLLRRLKTEGWTFLDLVDDSRKSLAKFYIEKTETSFQEITFLLGFKDSSTFYRAFKRWYGKTPSQFRQLLPRPVMSSVGNQLEPRSRL